MTGQLHTEVEVMMWIVLTHVADSAHSTTHRFSLGNIDRKTQIRYSHMTMVVE